MDGRTKGQWVNDIISSIHNKYGWKCLGKRRYQGPWLWSIMYPTFHSLLWKRGMCIYLPLSPSISSSHFFPPHLQLSSSVFFHHLLKPSIFICVYPSGISSLSSLTNSWVKPSQPLLCVHGCFLPSGNSSVPFSPGNKGCPLQSSYNMHCPTLCYQSLNHWNINHPKVSSLISCIWQIEDCSL